MAVPHGMLEPWSLKQKAVKKWIYWSLFEKRFLKKASILRAVGNPENTNLEKKTAKKVVNIANGVNFLLEKEKVSEGIN